ncbi:c-type cytochrome [Hymenobacter sp. RP-2-7]|uniref:C-type cytochrome n=1 Tax=Hymenobacter polaris TaxID=2682546 RepID=A0A7Y0AG35_9BACT|nr:di-heme oxidoredictase family protein [Hymenobacter polaris]NML66682.1 c-type cytochrome [Hymenobacter polaris]
MALLSATVLSACEKAQDDTGPLGTSVSQDAKAGPGTSSTDFAGPAGGSNTVNRSDEQAFNQPSPALMGPDVTYHNTGQGNFEQVFSLQQLVPLWNHNKCSGCHVAGGRSPLGLDPQVPQLLFRVSAPGVADDGGPNPVPGIGGQIQPFAIVNGAVGIGPEGTVSTTYVEQLQAFVDGQAYSLRTPTYTPSVALPAGTMLSPRIGPQIAGLGLLEAVAEQDIVALADPDDRDHDGITGRPNRVWDAAAQQTVLGRFGWKANQPNLLQQAAAAFNGDLGITSPFFPLESNVPGGGRNKKGPGVKLPSGGLSSITAAALMLKNSAASTTPTDIDTDALFSTAFYTGTLGVPATRNTSDPQVQAGQALFISAKCAVCHTPALRTSPMAPYGLGGQTIHPYTDLLLHDMGPGLADNRPDFLATGSEWRTPPLWGLGLSAVTSNHTNYLHDGRARNVLEAVMWHGGEGDFSRRYVAQLSQADRNALVAFVNSL